MRKLTFAMNMSLDGYIAAPGDDLGWSVPSDELFQWWSDRVDATGLALYGRKLWETMSPSGPGGRRHAFLHSPGQLGEPEPGGDPDVSRRRIADQVRDQALSARRRISAGFGPPKDLVALRSAAIVTSMGRVTRVCQPLIRISTSRVASLSDVGAVEWSLTGREFGVPAQLGVHAEKRAGKPPPGARLHPLSL